MKNQLLAEIKDLASEYNMVLNWTKVLKADITELTKILGLIKRTYANRTAV